MSALPIHSSIFLLLLIVKIAAAAPSLAKSDCKPYCGNVSIPYPFGIGDNCSLNKWFNISCNESSNSHTALLTSIQMEVMEISIESYYYYDDDDYYYYYYSGYNPQHVRVKSPIISQNCSSSWEASKNGINFSGSPFFFSADDNIFVAAGCDNKAFLAGTNPAIVGCQSSCKGDTIFNPAASTCTGRDTCCQTVIPSSLQQWNATFEDSKEAAGGPNSESSACKLAFIVEEEWFYKNISMAEVLSMQYVPALLTWGIADFESLNLLATRRKEYSCNSEENLMISCFCAIGYEGNPYLPNGCQDIDECMDPKRYNLCGKGTCVNKVGSYECERRKFWIILGLSLGFGVLLLFIGGWRLYKFLKKRRKINLKKKFFKRNGGLLLQQQMFSSEGGIQKAKIFASKELDKATDHFNKNRILGKGGQGTVYKGMLVNGQIVAVKKSIAMDADKVEDFINEVAILSHIDHRNVVKLLGCCLETEVPLLVYEFIPNGTLFQYLHDQTEEFHLTWEMRLRIAIESAEAISYLHSSASIPIYHRDIKSTNILLDEKYKAKVSDFGTSRSLAIDQTHLTTNVQGTFGYLDPEYFQSSQFTEKSDVYSFGVVLVELITGETPISRIKVEEEGRSLATHFMLSMQKNRLFEIVDARIMEDSVHEEIIATAKIAYRCLSLNGKKRPTMKEVAAELGRIPSLQKDSNALQTHEEEVEDVVTDHAYNIWEDASTSTTTSAFVTATASSLEIEPLIYNQNT